MAGRLSERRGSLRGLKPTLRRGPNVFTAAASPFRIARRGVPGDVGLSRHELLPLFGPGMESVTSGAVEFSEFAEPHPTHPPAQPLSAGCKKLHARRTITVPAKTTQASAIRVCQSIDMVEDG